MKRSIRHNYRDHRHVGRGVDVTEDAVQRSVSDEQFAEGLARLHLVREVLGEPKEARAHAVDWGFDSDPSPLSSAAGPMRSFCLCKSLPMTILSRLNLARIFSSARSPRPTAF